MDFKDTVNTICSFLFLYPYTLWALQIGHYSFLKYTFLRQLYFSLKFYLVELKFVTQCFSWFILTTHPFPCFYTENVSLGCLPPALPGVSPAPALLPRFFFHLLIHTPPGIRFPHIFRSLFKSLWFSPSLISPLSQICIITFNLIIFCCRQAFCTQFIPITN